MKVLKNKGFTLAELLIVMAVVVVLAAATMPAVSGQIESARESIDIDTLRAAYTEAYLQAYSDANSGVTFPTDGYAVSVTLVQKVPKWQGSAPKIGGLAVTGDPATGAMTATFKFTAVTDAYAGEALSLTSVALSSST